MKLDRILILLLIAISFAQANPHRRHRIHPSYHANYYYTRYGERYYPHSYYAYGSYRYFAPAVITTTKITSYPQNLVVLSADDIVGDIEALNKLMSRGMITKKDFERSKTTLLNRIGMTVNPDASISSTAEIIAQIEMLYKMKSDELLSDREYQREKKKLLAMI
ncbi:MAG: hypothetical protein K9N35_03885 [Candidatus Marinimicrobia bacterium]|nr:hypothetical protein [Candidatus Neomarinimicrobiota bacterium]